MAVALIAWRELRARWAGIVVIGVLAGLVGGVVVSALVVARRTATADDRLAAATKADDVRSEIFGGRRDVTMAIGDEAIGLPQVARGRVALGGVARVDAQGIVYRSVMIAPERWGDDVLSPVLSAGRLPRPDRADEVVVNEAAVSAPPYNLNLGTTLVLHFLTADEYAAFDASKPVEGRAGSQSVTVVGTVRLPGNPQDLAPLIGTPALADAHPQGIGEIGIALVQLKRDADTGAYIDAVHGLTAPAGRPAALAGFPIIRVQSTAPQSRAPTNTATNVVISGLLVLAGVTAVAGSATVVQAIVRQARATATTQQVEAAMGLTARERGWARMVAATPAAAIAAGVTAALGVIAGRIEPIGSLRQMEPHPGWSPNVAFIVTASLIVAVALLGAVRVSATRAARVPLTPRPRAATLARVVRLGPRLPSALGVRFAIDRPAGTRTGGNRAAMVTVAGGVAGLIAALIFSASLNQLVATPARYGSPTDLVIADAGRDIATSFANDSRFDTVITGESADLLIDGRAASGTTQEALAGRVQWELATGRPPMQTDEIVLGTRLARELHKRVHDRVSLQDVAGAMHQLTVVGVGVVPNYGGGGLGRSAALVPGALEAVASSQPSGALALGVRPGVSVTAVAGELASRYEVDQAQPPHEVANLQQIDRIPSTLAILLGGLCVATLTHAVTATARQRRRDLAITRALGLRPRQSAIAVVIMAVTTAVVGLVVALPLGLLAGRSIWRRVAEGSALLDSVAYPVIALVAVVPIGIAIAVAVSAIPARRAQRDRIPASVRAE